MNLEKKIDRLIVLLSEQELHGYKNMCTSHKHMMRDLLMNTVLASIVGYFMFRIMDIHFRKAPETLK